MATSPPEPAVPFSTETAFSYKDATEEEILEDLTSRFILNLPDEELASLERICFQVEQAHWYYEDFIREENPRCPSLALKKFTTMMFTNCPVLQHWNHEEAFDKFMKYKTKVPVCGAIMLNEAWDKCVLVKGWKSSSGWGFPKGKINETEEKTLCAVREVLEETGYNLAGQVNPQHYLETVNNGQIVTLFIVPGVPEDYPFRTKTRKEISKIEWFKLIDLPGWRRAKQAPGKFYLITPFINQLKSFVNTNKPKKGRKGGAAEKPSNKGKSPIPVPKPPPPAEADALQDSSSQSSSLDNGDPQTPSPQYTESTAVFVPEIVSDQSEPSVPMESLDPHFARLLSGLTLSAVSEPPVKVESQLSTPQNLLRPTNAASQSPSTLTMPSISTVVPTDLNASVVNGAHGPDIQTPPNDVPAVPDAVSPRSVVQEVTGKSPKSPTRPAHSPRSPHVRKSSTADISPYLSRPQAEVPLSARRLQQLALLESVADESARKTPSIINGPGPGMNYFGGPPQFVSPALPQSMATAQSPYYHYPSQPTGMQQIPPSYSGHFGRPIHPQDPFIVRSRTSQALHRTGYQGSSGSMSMNQHQLLSLINGSQPNPGAGYAPQHPVPYPNSFGPQQAPYHPGPKMYGPPLSAGLPHSEYGGPPNSAMNRPRPFSTAPMPPAPPFASKPPNPSSNLLLSLLGSAPTPPNVLEARSIPSHPH